jgi:hypothetical protein
VGKNTPKKSPAGEVRRGRVAAQNQPAGNLQKRCCTNDISALVSNATAVAKAMEGVFIDKDPLLRSVGMVILYFLIFERATAKGLLSSVTRPALFAFDEQRCLNREKAEADIAGADYSLIEFDRYTQSPNDGIALRYRLAVMDKKVFGGKLGFEDLDA